MTNYRKKIRVSCYGVYRAFRRNSIMFKPLSPELNPICYLLALLAHHFLHVSRIRVKSLTSRLLMSYIYIYIVHLFLMFLDHVQQRSTVGRTSLDE
jgi:predicted neutral ceramidase superfamily lipid hydrolase